MRFKFDSHVLAMLLLGLSFVYRISPPPATVSLFFDNPGSFYSCSYLSEYQCNSHTQLTYLRNQRSVMTERVCCTFRGERLLFGFSSATLKPPSQAVAVCTCEGCTCRVVPPGGFRLYRRPDSYALDLDIGSAERCFRGIIY